MAIQNVKVAINGQTYDLLYNEETKKWENTLNAPGKSSYNEDGHYFNVEITAQDDAGNKAVVNAQTEGSIGESLRLVVKEKVKPIITILSPGADAFLANSQPEISISLKDDDSGIDINSFSLSIDSQSALNSSSPGMVVSPVEGGYDITYTPVLALEDGVHSLVVNVRDHDGNTGEEKSRSFTIDTVPPVLNVTNPTDNYVTNKTELIISGNTNDVTSGSVVVAILLNEIDQGEVIVEESGIFSKSVTLVEGSNIVKITATDRAGKSTTITRNVTLNTVAPKITSVELIPNPVDAGQTFIIKVQVS